MLEELILVIGQWTNLFGKDNWVNWQALNAWTAKQIGAVVCTLVLFYIQIRTCSLRKEIEMLSKQQELYFIYGLIYKENNILVISW